jgi:hypothetical protein
VLTNLVSIALLVVWFRQEGLRYWDLFRFERMTWKRDLLVVIGFFILSAPLVLLPNFALATWLYWRAGMFILFALFIAVLLRWRPRLLPYLVIGHGLLDLQTVLMLLPLSY